MKVAINETHKGKMPADMTPDESRLWWRAFNGNFANKELTVSEFVESIRQGYAYTTQHGRYRDAENYQAGQHVALDMDTKDERSTFEHLLKDPFIASNAAFLHTTPSHTAAAPKCRVVFVLDRPITSREKYTLLAESLVHRYGMADTKCKDCCRLFFGSEGCQVYILGNVLSLETAANELVRPYQDHLAQAEQERRERLATVTIIDSKDAPAGLLKAKADRLLDRVRNAPDGEKYWTLRDISNTFGGYVKGGYYNRLDVVSWLKDAIQANGNNVKDLRAAYRTIEESVAYGEGQPLYLELEQETEDEFSRVDPPLTDGQKAQVIAIHRELKETAVWRAYHDGMTRAQRLLWQLPDNILDHFGLGYRAQGIDKETGEILSDALTVPFLTPDGKVVNVEYRSPHDYTYENNEPVLFYVKPLFDDVGRDHTLILPDSVTAVKAYLDSLTGQYAVMALPHMPLTVDSLDSIKTSDITVLLEPDTETKGRGLNVLRNRARFLRLPFPLSQMRRGGEAAEMMNWYLSQARGWA